MAAAALVVLPIFFPFVKAEENPSHFMDYLIWFILCPLLIAGLVGSLLGASILDARRAGSGWRAGLRGLLIAVASYLLYAVVLSAWDGYANHGAFSPGEAFTRTLVMALMWGAIFFGWLAAIAGATAGWLLYLFAASLKKRSGLR
jgi:ABC-type multidrug transport system permease subunit